MQDARAVQVTVYLRESDQWRGKPLPLAILSYLRTENALAACIVQSVGGISRTSIGYHQPPDFDVGRPLPIVIIFVHTDEHVKRVLPSKEIAAHRLIVRENVVFEQADIARISEQKISARFEPGIVKS